MSSRWLAAVSCGAVVACCACRETAQPPSDTVAPAAAQPAPPETPVFDPALDDPRTPAWFPMPRDIGSWIRAAPVEVHAPDDPALAQASLLQRCAAGFSCTQVASCAFTSVVPGPPGLRAQALILETAGSDDAYGLFTVLLQGAAPDEDVATLSFKVIDGEWYARCCWQGPYVFQVSAETSDAMAQTFVDKLAAGLAEPVPGRPQPVMLGYFPHSGRVPGGEWFVRRDLQALPAHITSGALQGRAAQVASDLELGLDTSCAIVAYSPGDGQDPNFVWLVQYPDDQRADRAANRYRAALSRAGGAHDVLFEGPAGRFLCGSWTRGQESLPNMHIVQQILEKLPK